MSRRPLFIGVDGGGTGCRARLEDDEGRVLGTGIGGPAALRLGIDQSMAAVATACGAALAEAGLAAEALAGMDAAIGLSGIGRKGALEELMRTAASVSLRRLCQRRRHRLHRCAWRTRRRHRHHRHRQRRLRGGRRSRDQGGRLWLSDLR